MTELAPIAVQLYSLREELNENFRGIVEKVKDMGYTGVEPYNGLPVSHLEASRLFESLGLEVISAHMPLPVGDDRPTVLDAAAAYNLKYLVVPWMPQERFESVDSIKALCDELNEASLVARTHGYTLHYHNHDFEFREVDGRPAYDIFLEHLDDTIMLQVDTYWVKVGGQDPVELVKKLGDRAPLLHIKDGPLDKDQPMVAVGDGKMDIPAIVEAGKGHTQSLIVELDRCETDMVEAVAKSYQYMVGEGLARGNKN